MGLINQEGFFRGHIVSGEFNQTAKGLPREEWALKAEEMFDPDTQEFLPVDAEADEITAYLVMFNHDDSENFNTPQIKKLTGWDGANFNVLASIDLAGIKLSFQVNYGRGDYADKLGVDKVDMPDATSSRSAAKLDKATIDALQARFAGPLAKNQVAAKPVSAKDKKAAAAKAKASNPTRPAASRPTTPKPTAAVVGKCSAEDAYNECFALKRDDVTDDKLNKVWFKEVALVNEDEAKIIPEEWYRIKEQVVQQTAKV